MHPRNINRFQAINNTDTDSESEYDYSAVIDAHGHGHENGNGNHNHHNDKNTNNNNKNSNSNGTLIQEFNSLNLDGSNSKIENDAVYHHVNDSKDNNNNNNNNNNSHDSITSQYNEACRLMKTNVRKYRVAETRFRDIIQQIGNSSDISLSDYGLKLQIESYANLGECLTLIADQLIQQKRYTEI